MDRVRIGVLGAARIAPGAVVSAARGVPAAEVVAVAARDEDRAADFARRHGITVVAPSYDGLVEHPEVDAVYNPLPNGLHGRWTIRALEAGKHVLCEKPFTANADEARAVAVAAARAGRVAMEAMHYRYHPFAQRLVELAGTIGPVERVDARLIGVLPMRRDIRYRLGLAGGAFMDLGCYAVHQVRSVIAAEPTVVAARAKLISPGVDRWLEADLALPGGATGRATGALLAGTLPVADVRVRGDEGSVHAWFPSHPRLLGLIAVRSRGERARHERVPGDTTFTYQLRAFCDAILLGVTPLTGGDDAIANMGVIDAAYEAAGIGRRRPTPW
jgi:predicted dehydrogenase